MLIFFTQITNPDEKEQTRFEKMKRKMGELYRKEHKFNQKIGSSDRMIIKSGQRWFAVHQFI